MDSFSLDIDMGNELMSTPAHVAGALRRVAHELETIGSDSGRIRDENGNHVGGFAFDQLADKRPPTLQIKRVR